MTVQAKDGLYLIEPDKHMPFHDSRFSGMVLEAINWLRPQGYVQTGDFVDWWQLSTYDHDPARKDDIRSDLNMFSAYLDEVAKAMSQDTDIHILEGNHEDRLKRYTWRNAKGIACIVPPITDLLQFGHRNEHSGQRWFWHPYRKWDSCRLGDTVIHHGFYFDQSVALNNLKRYRQVNLLQGHTHRVQYATNGDHFAASLGHGSDVKFTGHKPAPEDWAQAIALLTVYKGKGSIEICQRIGDEIRIRGRVIRG